MVCPYWVYFKNFKISCFNFFFKYRNSGGLRRNPAETGGILAEFRQNLTERGELPRKKTEFRRNSARKKTEIFKSIFLLQFFEFRPKTMGKNSTGFRRNPPDSGGFRPEFRPEFGKRSAEFARIPADSARIRLEFRRV